MQQLLRRGLMLDAEMIRETLKASHNWEDTPEQAQLRECLTNILIGHTDIDTINIARDMINLMRDQLMSRVSVVRKTATVNARVSMTPGEIADATGQTKPTILRLSTEYRNI
jgi:hypothetical protein